MNFAVARKSFRRNAAAEALMLRPSATMRDGTYTRDHVEVRWAVTK